MWIGIILVGLISIAYIINRPTMPSRDERRAQKRVRELEDDIDTILDIAYEHKDVDPGLADIVIDEIKKMKQRDRQTKELY